MLRGQAFRLLFWTSILAGVGCSTPKPPQECVDAAAGLKSAGMAGPDGYAHDPKVPALIHAARMHDDDRSPACVEANRWADDAVAAKPHPITVATPGAIILTRSGGLLSNCYSGCDKSFDGCVKSHGCTGGAQEGENGTTRTDIRCDGQDKLDAASRECDLKACYSGCER